MARKLSGIPKSFRFSDDELKILNAAKARHGTYKDAIMAGLRAESGKEPTTDELLSMLRRRLR